MGMLISKVLDSLSRIKDARILMLGLDAAGKTTILYKLKLGEVISSVPTIGFNFETVEYKSIKFSVFDIGGQTKIRNLWKHYFDNNSALIYVIDSSDQERIQENKETLFSVLQSEEMSTIPVLIYANKQDQFGASDAQTLAKQLELNKLQYQQWYVQPTCGLTGDGLFQGLDWLANALKNNKNDKK